MTVPTLPSGLEPLRGFLDDLEDRVANLEQPQQPGQVYACTTANLPDAVTFTGCVVRDTTLNILAHSDGVHWLREDSGAIIV